MPSHISAFLIGEIRLKTGRIAALLLAAALLLTGCAKEGEAVFDGRTVAVAIETDDELAAEEMKTLGAKVVTYSSTADAVLALEAGKADYFITDELSGAGFIAAKRKLSFVRYSDYGVALRAMFAPDNSELCDRFNAAVAELTADGTVDKLRDAWLAGESLTPAEPVVGGDTLRVLCSTEMPDFFSIDENGEPAGIEGALLSEICSRMGCKYELVEVDFEVKAGALSAGAGDVVFSYMVETPELADSYLFSEPYFTLRFAVYRRG